jgi:hypothetical protein
MVGCRGLLRSNPAYRMYFLARITSVAGGVGRAHRVGVRHWRSAMEPPASPSSLLWRPSPTMAMMATGWACWPTDREPSGVADPLASPPPVATQQLRTPDLRSKPARSDHVLRRLGSPVGLIFGSDPPGRPSRVASGDHDPRATLAEPAGKWTRHTEPVETVDGIVLAPAALLVAEDLLDPPFDFWVVTQPDPLGPEPVVADARG